MFLVAAAILILLSVPLSGGSLRRLRGIRLRRLPILYAALGIQIVITEAPDLASRTVLSAVHVLTYAMLAVVVWANRQLPGIVLLGLGTGTNGLAITVNGGRMPASASALRAAGLPAQTTDFANSANVAHPHLAWLGDVMATPSFLPLHNMLSVGDLLILLGAVVLLHRCAAYRGTHRRPPAPRRYARVLLLQPQGS